MLHKINFKLIIYTSYFDNLIQLFKKFNFYSFKILIFKFNALMIFKLEIQIMSNLQLKHFCKKNESIKFLAGKVNKFQNSLKPPKDQWLYFPVEQSHIESAVTEILSQTDNKQQLKNLILTDTIGSRRINRRAFTYSKQIV